MPVLLSSPSWEDEEEFILASKSSRELHAPWVAAPGTHAEFETYLNRAAQPDTISYLLRDEESGGLVGFVNANNIVRGALRSAYLGYAAFVGFQGRGLMRTGLIEVINDLMKNHDLHRVESNVQPDNTRSIALVKGLGFHREGFSPRYLFIAGAWRDHERWAITAEDWFRAPQ